MDPVRNKTAHLDLRRALPFILIQSVPQALSVLAIFAALGLAASLIVPLPALKFVLPGALIGIMPSLLAVLPYQITIAGTGAGAAAAQTLAFLEKNRYARAPSASTPDVQVWIPLLPRWARFNEQNVIVRRSSEQLQILRPWMLLKTLSRRLNN